LDFNGDVILAFVFFVLLATVAAVPVRFVRRRRIGLGVGLGIVVGALAVNLGLSVVCACNRGAPPAEMLSIWPYAITMVLLLAVPTRRAAERGVCNGCGYNLTGNTSGLCPECGRRVGRVT
jgi:lipopolysaccharide export LptBFGC system permease protein LptF